ncbi:MAG: hypothetical protein ACK56I_29745, partial [bacterium]
MQPQGEIYESVDPDIDIEDKHYLRWELYRLMKSKIPNDEIRERWHARQQAIMTGKNDFTQERKLQHANTARSARSEIKKGGCGKRRSSL